ncbi:2-amino-4-hydroxy-6-hydroxymethyldihydropteridine diphosphokinase [Brevibacillus daliensis]|uniref:2-amino-4-hydroxy-6- hydroxymethyldihydropteridine diphosphokinase n=1 Tax=Brevibacillus daliensis TaxID=2892995 RepID=UPI001E4FA21F|nr:2-amino-4-hydroxy-6-hydroxymethyldihydropteridine diphosphokinase [Brevibacillus daliensis]
MKDGVTVFISLGSNQGVREHMLMQAILELNAHPAIMVKRLSYIYETDPVGYTEQPAFLNIVAELQTELGALDLLEEALRVEKELGRVRKERWGPRLIDIDILLYGEEQIILPTLTIPHPEMVNRAFVLVPLRELWQGTIIGTGVTIDEALKRCEETQGVLRWGTLDWEAELERSEN